MAEENDGHSNDLQERPQDRRRRRWPAKRLLTAIGISIGLALVCFVVLAFLPSSELPFFDSPLRSALTGLGLLGIAYPLVIAGMRLHARAALSPYYEETFIAAVVLLFGLICLGFSLLCIGLSVYALIVRLIGGQ